MNSLKFNVDRLKLDCNSMTLFVRGCHILQPRDQKEYDLIEVFKRFVLTRIFRPNLTNVEKKIIEDYLIKPIEEQVCAEVEEFEKRNVTGLDKETTMLRKRRLALNRCIGQLKQVWTSCSSVINHKKDRKKSSHPPRIPLVAIATQVVQRAKRALKPCKNWHKRMEVIKSRNQIFSRILSRCNLEIGPEVNKQKWLQIGQRFSRVIKSLQTKESQLSTELKPKLRQLRQNEKDWGELEEQRDDYLYVLQGDLHKESSSNPLGVACDKLIRSLSHTILINRTVDLGKMITNILPKQKPLTDEQNAIIHDRLVKPLCLKVQNEAREVRYQLKCRRHTWVPIRGINTVASPRVLEILKAQFTVYTDIKKILEKKPSLKYMQELSRFLHNSFIFNKRGQWTPNECLQTELNLNKMANLAGSKSTELAGEKDKQLIRQLAIEMERSRRGIGAHLTTSYYGLNHNQKTPEKNWILNRLFPKNIALRKQLIGSMRPVHTTTTHPPVRRRLIF